MSSLFPPRCRIFSSIFVVAVMVLTAAFSRGAPAGPYPFQLVHIRLNLSKDDHIARFRSIVERAVKHGYTGVLFDGSFDRIDLRDPVYADRLLAVKKICDENKMALIPLVLSAGYAGGILAHDRMLAVGVPAKDVPFVVKNGTVYLSRDRGIGLVNGGFEQHDNDRATGWRLQDHPGRVSIVDRQVVREGSASLRFENLSRSKDGKGRLMQSVGVSPFRQYRLSFWLKTEALDNPGGFQVVVMTSEDRVLMSWQPKLESTQDWKQMTLAFNSVNYDNVRIYVGIWRGRGGTFWIDGIELSEIGLMNVLRRPGTPFVVKNAKTGFVYIEGEDFEPLEEAKLSYKLDHAEPILKIKRNGRIREGDRLTVDYYHALGFKRGGHQTSVCMSEPKTYEIMSGIARRVDELIKPDFYLLSMDEIRQGGWCAACVGSGLSAAEILGECIKKQVEIVRRLNPKAEVFIWSDMLDPNHNAKAEFCLFNGDLTGSWEHIPKDLIIACWSEKICEKSLRHFDELGFRTIGCGYYDRRNLKNVKRWTKALGKTTGACGIMYTTWKHDYDFLEQFGDVAQGREPGK